MNKPSHILIGKYLCQYVNDHYKILLEPKSYVLGNVLPDYYLSFLIRPHCVKYQAAHVQNIIRLLLTQRSNRYSDKKYSRFLGILCHFYADFFCYAHNDNFTGGISEHIAYENNLHRYLVENLEQLNSIRFITQPSPVTGVESIYRKFETLHSDYLSSHASFGNDLTYSLTACIDLIVSICGYAAAKDGPRSFHHIDKLEAV